MIEVKQLQYLVTAADMKSFSRAADYLYTTQPNVSKVIHNLETELGFELFVRTNNGIKLTEKGRQVYAHAMKLLDDVNALTLLSGGGATEELRIDSNPSSWMANCFTEFYKAHEDEAITYHMITASTEKIIQRVGDGVSDIGFITIMEAQLPSLEFKMDNRRLQFMPLKEVKAMVYLGNNENADNMKSIEDIDFSTTKLVQCYEDEFTLKHYGDLLKKEQQDNYSYKVSVMTNSDYVMQSLLNNTNLANVSSSRPDGVETENSFPLFSDQKKAIFGFIFRKDRELKKWVKKYIEHVKLSL